MIARANRNDGATSSYGYDSVGNRISNTDTGAGTTLNYTPNSNKLASSTRIGLNRVWNYDANGNTQSFTATNGVGIGFSYDAFNRMVASAVDGGASTTYSINTLGQRGRKTGPNGDSRIARMPCCSRKTVMVWEPTTSLSAVSWWPWFAVACYDLSKSKQINLCESNRP